jgi:hypothetical protein
MRRLSFWPVLVVLLLGILLLREPRFEKLEETFLRWLLRNAQPRALTAPLTVIEIGRDQPLQKKEESPQDSADAFLHGAGAAISPLEYALFLQSVLEFQPTVIAFENILKWRERDKDQEQVFLDQAMRVPKLLLGAELTSTPDPDQLAPDIPIFTQVSGSRGHLVEFSGIGRQPNEDMRLISRPGFINLPEEIVDDLHVPLLFRYRGEVIPAFALEAVLLWLRITPAEVKIELPSRVLLPGDREIPIRADGTLLINPLATKSARRLALNQCFGDRNCYDPKQYVFAQGQPNLRFCCPVFRDRDSGIAWYNHARLSGSRSDWLYRGLLFGRTELNIAMVDLVTGLFPVRGRLASSVVRILSRSEERRVTSYLNERPDIDRKINRRTD